MCTIYSDMHVFLEIQAVMMCDVVIICVLGIPGLGGLGNIMSNPAFMNMVMQCLILHTHLSVINYLCRLRV